MRATGLISAACLLAAGTTAEAAEPSALLYEAVPGCPDRAGFIAEVRAWTDQWQQSEGAARTFIVNITRGDGPARGSVVVRRPGKNSSPRVVETATCAETARALAFIVALSIDPAAERTRAADAPASTSPTVPDRATSTLPEATPKPPSVPSVASAPSNRTDTSAPSPPQRATTAQNIERWSAGLTVDVLGLAAPGPVLGGGFFVGFRPFSALDLRASLHQTLPSTVNTDLTRTSLTWTTGRLEPCVHMLHAGRLDVHPCLFVEIGRMVAQGGGVEKTERASRLWRSFGLSARLDLAVTAALRLELAGGLFATLDRSEITYRPALMVYRPPAVGAGTSIGVAVRWH